jgi:hypothetical protein
MEAQAILPAGPILGVVSGMPDKGDLLLTWQNRCDMVQAGHYRAASEFQRWHSILGVPVVVLTTVVGSSIFASMDKDAVATWIKLLTGFLSILAAGMSAAQTFLRFGERGEKHRQAGVAYSALKREIEQMIAYPDSDVKACVDDIRKRWDTLNSDCPTIPLRFMQAGQTL